MIRPIVSNRDLQSIVVVRPTVSNLDLRYTRNRNILLTLLHCVVLILNVELNVAIITWNGEL